MPDLSPEQVLAHLTAIGLTPKDQDDLDEITHRVNAVNNAVLGLEHAELESQEPISIFWLGEDGAQ